MDFGNYPEILGRLEAEFSLRPCGEHAWYCRCPCRNNHSNGDRRPSCKVWIEPSQGDLRIHCYRGCRWPEIAQALGYPRTAWASRFATQYRKPIMSRVIERYEYVDEYGELCFASHRTDPKGFFLARPTGGKWWALNLQAGLYAFHKSGYMTAHFRDGYYKLLDPVPTELPEGTIELPAARIVPYRLPQILACPDEPIVLVEGEKDVHACEKLQLLGSCNPMGSGKFCLSCAKYFRGRRVAILPDKDDVGLAHAYSAAAMLLRCRAASVRVVDEGEYWQMPGKDLSDFVDSSLSLETARRLVTTWLRSAPEYRRMEVASCKQSTN